MMTLSPFDQTFDDLPADLPVFPLTGALLLPGGRLPLNIFEPRYLAMIDHAMGCDRLIGMAQPDRPDPGDNVCAPGCDPNPALYATGCAGRIVQYEETDDGRYLVLLKGLCRFRITAEPPPANCGFRHVVPDWQPFAADLAGLGCRCQQMGKLIDRRRFDAVLRGYFELHQLSADWERIARTPDEHLVTTLAMICPFSPCEKQALLEAPDTAARGAVMLSLIEMAVHEGRDGCGCQH